MRSKIINIVRKLNNTFAGPGKMKTLRHSACPRMKKTFYEWFLKQRGKTRPVTDLIIQEKAKMFHREYKEFNYFNASSGWLQKFKKHFWYRLLNM